MMRAMNRAVGLVFVLVYVGMVLGRLPRLQLDRTGVALLGALALLATGAVGLDEASRSVDGPTTTTPGGAGFASVRRVTGTPVRAWSRQSMPSRPAAPLRGRCYDSRRGLTWTFEGSRDSAVNVHLRESP